MLDKLISFGSRRFNAFLFRILVFLRGGYIPFNCILDLENLSTITVGNNFRLGAFSRISVSSYGKLDLGSNISTGHNLTLYCSSSIAIRDNCRFAHSVTITDSKYINPLQDPRLYMHSESRPILINQNTLVYTGAIILLNVTIPANSTVAAYAIVHSGLPLTEPGIIFGSSPSSSFKPYHSSWQ